MVHREGGNLRKSLFNLGKLLNFLLLVGLSEKCSSMFPCRLFCMKHLSCCLTLLLTLGESWGLFAKKLTLEYDFPAKKSGHSDVSPWSHSVLRRGQGKSAVREEKLQMGTCVSGCFYPIKPSKGHVSLYVQPWKTQKQQNKCTASPCPCPGGLGRSTWASFQFPAD